MSWDRSKQKYWVARNGQPWRVLTIDGNKYVADYLTENHDTALLEKVCFAADDDEVIKLLDQERPEWDKILAESMVWAKCPIVESKRLAKISALVSGRSGTQ